MDKIEDKKVKAKKVGKILKQFFIGNNIFHIFFRVYIFVIILGGVLLYVPWTHSEWTIPNVTTEGTHPYTFWNALFIACSAFTNTGLTCVNVSTFFNFAGQFVIFILIWLGGVGIISLFYVLWNFFKKGDEVKMNQIIMLQSERGSSKLSNTFRSIRFSVVFIIVVQIIFGFLMSFWLCWMPVYVQGTTDLGNNVSITFDTPQLVSSYHNYPLALWQGIFCSFSAMNNAGFDIFQQNISLSAFRNDWNVLFQLMTMIEIVLGGIGYPLIFDVYEKIRLKRKNIHYRFSLFSKVCAVSYVLVFVIGLSISFGFEFGAPNTGNMLSNNATLMSINNIPGCKYWGNNELFNKCWALVYNATASRSAGFSTFKQCLLTVGSQTSFNIMMFIGASPSSTGGGIRTTTLAVILATLIATIRGRTNISLFKRNIPRKTVANSFLVFFVSLVLVFVCAVLVMYTPNVENPTQRIGNVFKINIMSTLYEVTSAFGTVGFTMGITAISGPFALVILIICMFVGQLGVSTSLLAWVRRVSFGKNIQYAEEDIKIG